MRALKSPTRSAFSPTHQFLFALKSLLLESRCSFVIFGSLRMSLDSVQLLLAIRCVIHCALEGVIQPWEVKSASCVWLDGHLGSAVSWAGLIPWFTTADWQRQRRRGDWMAMATISAERRGAAIVPLECFQKTRLMAKSARHTSLTASKGKVYSYQDLEHSSYPNNITEEGKHFKAFFFLFFLRAHCFRSYECIVCRLTKQNQINFYLAIKSRHGF